MFIPVEMRPKQKPIDETSLSYIFNIFDETLEVKKYEPVGGYSLFYCWFYSIKPSAEMIEKAYNHYNKNLHKKVFLYANFYFFQLIFVKKI